MPLPPVETYRATGGGRFAVVLLVIFAFLAVDVAVLYNLPEDLHGGIMFGVMVGIALTGTAVGLVVSFALERAAKRRHAAMLQGDGYEVALAPTPAQQANMLLAFAPLGQLRNVNTDVEWMAWKTIPRILTPASTDRGPARDAVAFRHCFVIGAGRSARQILHTVVAWPTPDLTPAVWLTRTGWFQRHRDERHGVQDIQLGDEPFDNAFRVQSADEAVARRTLTPELRAFLLAGPKRERWTLGGGWATCVFEGDATPQGLAVMIRRARAVADEISQS
jgi:hypothetical protein